MEESVTTNRTFIKRHPRGALTPGQELELWLGPRHHDSAFDSREELQQAWARHRDRLMALWAKNGRRPQGWWAFESPIPFPGYGREKSKLYELGLLDQREQTELEAWWREQFEKAQVPNFSLCTGPDSFLRGAAARKAHLAWADVPSALIKQWTRQRKRRRSQELEPTATEKPAPAA
jgi:hypothetical protein